MKKTLKCLLLIVLALALTLSAFVACDKKDNGGNQSNSESGTGSNSESGTGSSSESGTGSTEEKAPEDFDYSSAKISEFVTISKNDYTSTTVTLGTQYIITDDTVNGYINEQRFEDKFKTNGDTQVTDQPIKLGDSAFIYYTGYLDGVAFNGGSNASDTKPYELSIGSGSFIPGFEEGLIGIIPADTSKDAPYDLHVTFPEQYGNADLAGKAVIFKVWIEYTVQYTIPEFNDDYVKNTLKYDGSAEEFKAYIKGELEASALEGAQGEAVSMVITSLTEKATFHKYPQESLDYWYNNYVAQIQQYVDMYAAYGMQVTLEQMAYQLLGLKEGDDWQAALREMAKGIVENILVYYAVAEMEEITVTSEDILAEAEKIAKENSTSNKTYTAEEVIEIMTEKGIAQNLLVEKVEKLIIDECTIVYEDK